MSTTKTTGGLKFESKYYADDDHGSVPLIAEHDALRSMFSWYRLKGLGDFFDPKSKATGADVVKVIQDHYAKVSDHFGYTVLPPENFINELSYGFMSNHLSDKAAAFFQLNVKNYPESANVHDSMGDYYLAQKDTVQAIANFTKALSIESNKATKEKLEKLKKKK
jgi:hypothetical protein